MPAPLVLAEVAGLILLVGVLLLAASATKRDDEET
jgi:hypothetical protein